MPPADSPHELISPLAAGTQRRDPLLSESSDPKAISCVATLKRTGEANHEKVGIEMIGGLALCSVLLSGLRRDLKRAKCLQHEQSFDRWIGQTIPVSV